ncbi:hypothetical protein D1614_18120 [Maribellus luteus]|uniref:RDD domain-containing protein n=1 Tax=Maribellus luteus TaxID=2305463 RepID=A0A399STB4_9BACT|nr:hypothetical protein D1614_18120 [Maribellus luteus]
MEKTENLIVNKTIRFVDFIIDTLVYLIVMVLLVFVLRDYVDQYYIRYISVVVYFLYYFLFEYLVGQTPGKMITKARVVCNNPEFRVLKLFIRTVSRFIPIDIISYLFFVRGFHDWTSKTSLIRKQ